MEELTHLRVSVLAKIKKKRDCLTLYHVLLVLDTEIYNK